MNLYFDSSRGRYRYRHPVTGRFHPLASDRATAIQQAKILNEKLIPLKDHVVTILQPDSNEFDQFLDTFQNQILLQQKLSDATVTDYRQKLVHIRRELGGLNIKKITVNHIANFLDSIGGDTNANRYRSLLIQIFKHARAKGLTETNPAEATLPRKVTVERERLSLDHFKIIQSAAPTWCANAMELALQTLQRRGDLVNLKWSDIEGDYLRVQQTKVERHGTGKIKILITAPLKELLARMDDGIDSPYIIHKQPIKRIKSKQKRHWTQVSPEELSRAFQASRERTKLYDGIAPEKQPTFHEIRSLGIRLYTERGLPEEAVKALSGHASEAMYRLYLSRTDPQWIIAENAGLVL